MGPKRLATKINFFFDPELLRRANEARRGAAATAIRAELDKDDSHLLP